MGDRDAYFRVRRDKVRGGPARVPQPCGTVAAARRHERAGEPVCAACRDALRAHQRQQYERRRDAKKGPQP